jgi:hypothetical protein
MDNFLRYLRRNAFQFGLVSKALFLVALLWAAYFSTSLFAEDSNFAMGKYHGAAEFGGSVFWQLTIISLLVFAWICVKSISPLLLSLLAGAMLAYFRGEQVLLIALAVAALCASLYLCGYFVFGRRRQGAVMSSVRINSDRISRI